jgi:hypothetical protein
VCDFRLQTVETMEENNRNLTLKPGDLFLDTSGDLVMILIVNEHHIRYCWVRDVGTHRYWITTEQVIAAFWKKVSE